MASEHSQAILLATFLSLEPDNWSNTTNFRVFIILALHFKLLISELVKVSDTNAVTDDLLNSA